MADDAGSGVTETVVGLPSLPVPPILGELAESFIARVRALAGPPVQMTDDEKAAEGWSLHTVYGELCPRSVAALFSIALSSCTSGSSSSHGGLTFVDLGSGEGVPALVARGLFSDRFGLARGVELLPRVHRVACALAAAAREALKEEAAKEEVAETDNADTTYASNTVNLFSRNLRAWTCDGAAPPPTVDEWREATVAGAARDTGAGLQLLCDDFLDGSPEAAGWPKSADIVFFNGTCYGIDFLERVWRAAEKMRPGSILIVTTHEMPGRLFELIAAGGVAASWGSAATARIYRRLPLPRWIAGVVGRHARATTTNINNNSPNSNDRGSRLTP